MERNGVCCFHRSRLIKDSADFIPRQRRILPGPQRLGELLPRLQAFFIALVGRPSRTAVRTKRRIAYDCAINVGCLRTLQLDW